MKEQKYINVDGNTAVAKIAYKLSEVIAIYPITPSTSMGELSDEWACKGEKNIFGNPVIVKQMQSEGGVAGAVHGSAICGALTTTFTCSQGLLLMIPNMYKIAGELLPVVFHVTARAVASHALSIFGDHSDVMACRSTGFNMICSASVQECEDMALITHISALNSSLPFIHFFDGFRTSHEIQKIIEIDDQTIKNMLPLNKIEQFKNKALDPNNPIQMGTAQNPDIFFQNREACNVAYGNVYNIVKSAMKTFENETGRAYLPYEYYGSSNAKNVVIAMGSATKTLAQVAETICKNGEDVGVLNVRLFRPFSATDFCKVLPNSVVKIAVLDKCKDVNANGEPLFKDVVTAVKMQNKNIQVFGGRYGLGGKEFTPEFAKAVFDNLKLKNSKNNFSVGINDDVCNLSLPQNNFDFPLECKEYKFFGLGSDGTVSANKNTIKIIGENSSLFTQGFFEYDSKKSGSLTISHLRTAQKPIDMPYTITSPEFVAIHNFSFIGRYDLLNGLAKNSTVLLNTVLPANQLDKNLPLNFKNTLKTQNAKLFIIDAQKIATENGLGNKINVIMQASFFKVSNILNFETSVTAMKTAVKNTYGKKGPTVVEGNIKAIEAGCNNLIEVDVNKFTEIDHCSALKTGNDYYDNFIKPIDELKGNCLGVSAFNPNGAVPTDTTKFQKRGIALNVPKWIPENCIACGLCSASCPHACLRATLSTKENLKVAPDTYKTIKQGNLEYRMQVSPLDCTGCGVCAKVCPLKNKALEMAPTSTQLDAQVENYKFSLLLKQEPSPYSKSTPKGLQFAKPYFEFNFACAGCGETPYIKIATQLFGDKMVIANATGCSSIYGGSAPACPYAKDCNGKGPAWANSLFEDNAEFGMGMSFAREATKKGKSVWIIGGDGWAYDIGYGGLDHLLCSKENVNVLVLDSEVYSNTGGQQSKSTQRGALAKFASNGKSTKKKNLALLAIMQGNAYVAQVALGANPTQTIKAFQEAEAFDGPSIIIAYSPCINHGFNMSNSNIEMKRAVQSGYWNLFRFNPNETKKFTMDSDLPILEFEDFLSGETRFSALEKINPDRAKFLFEQCKKDAQDRYDFLKKLEEIL
ncbi:MAG: pyruvate:ferredoxin (flavodoxin) oxidoreductase [Clostridia bacterium]